MQITKQKYLREFRERNPTLSGYSDEEILAKAKEKRPDLEFVEEKGYFEELGGKVARGVDNFLTDAADLTVGNIVRGFGGDYEAKPIRHNLGLEDVSDYEGGFLGKSAKYFSEAWDTTAKGHNARVKRLDEQYEKEGGNAALMALGGFGRSVYDFGGNMLGAFSSSIGEGISSAGDTLIQDETQEEIKQYIAEQVKESETLTGIVNWYEKYQKDLELLKEYAPESYSTHKASIGFLEGFVDLATAKVGSITGKGIKNGLNSSLDISKNMLKKADDAILKLKPLVQNIGENLDNVKTKENFFTKIEEKIAGIDEQTKNILKNTSEEDFDNYLNYAKNAVDDVRNPTPLEVAGDEAGDVLKILGNLKNQAGASKSQALKMVENMEIDTKPIFDDFVNFLEKSNLTIDPEGKIKNIAGKVASVGDDSIRDIQNLSDEMLEIFTREKIDLGSLDALVDRVQDGINFKALNRPGATPSKTEKQISGFLGKSLNDRLKSVAGEDFVKYNEEFRKFLNLETKLSKLLGEDGNKGGSLMKAVFSPTDRGVKKLFTEIQKETGVDLISKAGLAKFAMQAVGDARQASLLEALDLGTGFTGKLKNNLSKIPIVGNVLDFAEDGAKKVFSPEKIGKKISQSKK